MDVLRSNRIEFYEPLVDVLGWFKGLLPTSFKPGRPHFNFITVHYMYLISLTIIGSIILNGARLMPYTDSLFFSAGASTQSGLNTVDVNNLQTYQQVTLFFIACIANPVFINTAVVFIRLYWFEKRFQGIVKEANKSRRLRTLSRSKSQVWEDRDGNIAEKGLGVDGVNGRPINVLHPLGHMNGRTATAPAAFEDDMSSPKTKHTPGADSAIDSDKAASLEGDKPAETYLGRNPLLRRDIAFADEQRPASHASTGTPPAHPDDGSDRLPGQRSADAHIAFLEKQRKKDTTLRIPGPRDFDKGDLPQEVSDDEDGNLDRTRTVDTGEAQAAAKRSSTDTAAERTAANPVKKGIAFEEPSRPPRETADDKDDHAAPSPRFNVLRPFSTFGRKHRINSNVLSSTMHKLGNKTRTFSFARTATNDRSNANEIMPYLSWQPTIGRNSAFIDLSEEQREELGGIEYRSLKTLAIILVCYFVGFHLLGMIVLLPWIILNDTYGSVVDGVAQSRAWWGIFTPSSMFNDLGYTLTPDSMISFQSAVLPLLFGSFLIVIGNTGFPCMLRFTIWFTQKLVPSDTPLWEELRFLLDHPRRCFTLLFPSKATWWLFWLLVLLNGIDLLFFIILDLNDPTVTNLPVGTRILVGWFQAVSTRTAGFAAINLADLHPAIQVSYLVMMYISVFPIAISVRRTNVYEEKSLGLWGGEAEDEEGNKSYVGTHLRRQLSFDLWYIFLGLFIIAIAEGRQLDNTNEYAFTLFSVLFEIVSAYGTVGLSLGYPNTNASFSAQFGIISKLIIVAMMIRGRHRGLPYALDRAILLPSEALHKKESEEAARRAGRRNSMKSTVSGGPLFRDALGGPDPSISAATANGHGVTKDGKVGSDSSTGEDEYERNALHNTDSVAVTSVSGTHGFGPLGRRQSEATAGGNSPILTRRGMHARRGSEVSDRPLSTKARQRTLTGLISAALTAGPSSPGSFKKSGGDEY